MLYMKEMRAKVVAECTLKESAAINQILGRRVSILDSKSFAKFLAKFKRKPKNIGSISQKKQTSITPIRKIQKSEQTTYPFLK